MNAEETAIYNLLIADFNVTSKIAIYDGSPAVFNGEAPQDFNTDTNAFVVFNGVASPNWDSHDTPGYDVMIDIRCYAPRTGSIQGLNDLAQAVREAIHWAKPVIVGRALVNLAALGISILPEEVHTVGRVITAQMRTQAA